MRERCETEIDIRKLSRDSLGSAPVEGTEAGVGRRGKWIAVQLTKASLTPQGVQGLDGPIVLAGWVGSRTSYPALRSHWMQASQKGV